MRLPSGTLLGPYGFSGWIAAGPHVECWLPEAGVDDSAWCTGAWFDLAPLDPNLGGRLGKDRRIARRLACDALASGKLGGAPLMAAALLGATGSRPPGVAEKTKLALRVLQLRHPEIAWSGPPLQAELTDDGITDLAVVGTDPEMVVVALILGPVDGDSNLVRVGWRVGGSGDLDPKCARDATLTLEELDIAREVDAAGALETEVARSRGVKGLCLTAPPCDVFHLYWDKAARSLS